MPSSREQRLDRALREAILALDFYGNPGSYIGIGFVEDRPCGDFAKDFSNTDLGKKPGKRARETFLKIGKILEVR